jgi:hypothetical protein
MAQVRVCQPLGPNGLPYFCREDVSLLRSGPRGQLGTRAFRLVHAEPRLRMGDNVYWSYLVYRSYLLACMRRIRPRRADGQ